MRSTGLPPQIKPDARLAEIPLGEWEGRLYAELDLSFAASEADGTAIQFFDRAPGGGYFAAGRCLSFLQGLAGLAVLVTHGVTSRMMRAILVDMDVVKWALCREGRAWSFT